MVDSGLLLVSCVFFCVFIFVLANGKSISIIEPYSLEVKYVLGGHELAGNIRMLLWNESDTYLLSACAHTNSNCYAWKTKFHIYNEESTTNKPGNIFETKDSNQTALKALR
jgi:hypothetical protein